MGAVLLLTVQRHGPAAYIVHDESEPGRTTCGRAVGGPVPDGAQPSAAEQALAADARHCRICFPDERT